jgi:hypothetical protein
MARVYGKPFSKMVGKPITMDRNLLNRLGQVLVESVVEEAKKDFAKRNKPGMGRPVGIPDSQDFFDSFSYRVTGNSSLEVYSTWPTIKPLTEGRDRFKMAWLTRQNGVNVVPIIQPNGTVIFRMAPLNFGEAWIHPGFARHTFIERGIRKGRERMAAIIVREVSSQMDNMDFLR